MANDYNSALIEEFRANNGKLGGRWANSQLVLVNTIGANSGQVRTIPLVHLQQKDRIYIVGSAAGSEKHPAWYHNLATCPEIAVQVGADRFAARARTATPAEKPALWAMMAAIFPLYDKYQARAGRDIPLVIVERAG